MSECDYSFHVGGQCVSVGLAFQRLWTKSVSECDYSFHVGGQCVSVGLVFQCWWMRSLFECKCCFIVGEQTACLRVIAVFMLVNKEHVSV